MKIKGEKIINDNIEVVVIPRAKESLVFKFKPILNFNEFDNYVKEPTAPTITKANGEAFLDLSDKDYLDKRIKYAILKQNWMFFQSMLATDDLEFESIELNNPDTWNNIDDELEKSEFTVVERNLLYNAFQRANSLNEDRLKEARESFLATTQMA